MVHARKPHGSLRVEEYKEKQSPSDDDHEDWLKQNQAVVRKYYSHRQDGANSYCYGLPPY